MTKTGLITLTQAARKLGEPASFVRGVAYGMALEMERVGRARVLDAGQFKELRDRVRAYKSLAS